MSRERSFKKFAWLALMLLAGCLASLGQGRTETEVKGLFFVTLARYTEWPEHAFASSTSPIVIGVLGADPFGPLLESLTANEEVRGRPLKVTRFASADEVRDCHLLFVGQMSSVRMEVELSKLRGRPILTVSENAGFAQNGGMVELYVNADKKVRIKASKSALGRAKLELSPSLLRLAQLVAWLEWVPEKVEPAVSQLQFRFQKTLASAGPPGRCQREAIH